MIDKTDAVIRCTAAESIQRATDNAIRAATTFDSSGFRLHRDAVISTAADIYYYATLDATDAATDLALEEYADE